MLCPVSCRYLYYDYAEINVPCVISLPFYALSTGSESLNASHEYKLLIHHFFLFRFTTVHIHKSLSFTPGLKPTVPVSQILLPHSFTSSSLTALTYYCPDRFF